MVRKNINHVNDLSSGIHKYSVRLKYLFNNYIVCIIQSSMDEKLSK